MYAHIYTFICVYVGLPRWLSGTECPCKQEKQAVSLHWEDRLEEEMATHSSIFAWKTLWTEEPVGLQSMRSQKSQTWLSDWPTKNVNIIFLGSKITADADCSHEIKKCLLLGRKAMTNLDSVLKSRDITLPTKVQIVNAVPGVMYRCESWTIKKTEYWRIDAFKLWFWRRLLRVPWTARSNQSILKEINPEYSLEGLILKLKLQHFGHLMWRANSVEKTLMLGKVRAGEGGNGGWDGWMASLTQWTWVWANLGRQWRTGEPHRLQFMGVAESDTT